MPRPRRRPMCYTAVSLHDGTVLAAYPMRKPATRIMKRYGMTIEPDGLINESARAGRELADGTNEGRFRFQDVISNRLNTRAIRDLVLPLLTEIHAEIAVLRSEVVRLATAATKP